MGRHPVHAGDSVAGQRTRRGGTPTAGVRRSESGVDDTDRRRAPDVVGGDDHILLLRIGNYYLIVSAPRPARRAGPSYRHSATGVRRRTSHARNPVTNTDRSSRRCGGCGKDWGTRDLGGHRVACRNEPTHTQPEIQGTDRHHSAPVVVAAARAPCPGAAGDHRPVHQGDLQALRVGTSVALRQHFAKHVRTSPMAYRRTFRARTGPT